MPNKDESRETYDPRTTRLLEFHDRVPAFLRGDESPRDYLEGCMATIEAREPRLRAFAAMDLERARAAADASAARYAAATPLSAIDGMPVGVKDLYDTVDLPTQLNSPLYDGHRPSLDAACVHALKRLGAVIVGKTTTTEFGLGASAPTRNPFDLERTPGGSSSGSAAAVGARMLPAALGSQVGGSIIRPAAFCANYGFKPSFGALNRGGGHSLAPSGSHLGTHAGSLEDLWSSANLISAVAGPDPGELPLPGDPRLPPAVKPAALLRYYCGGWELTDGASRHQFEGLVEALAKAGVTILEPEDHPITAALEADFRNVRPFARQILGYEMLWKVRQYRQRGEHLLSARIHELLAIGESMSQGDYLRALAYKAGLQAKLAAVAPLAEGFVSPASPGPAPLGIESTGNSVYQVPTSVAGVPSMTLPLLAVDDLPLGVQIFGFRGGDAALAARARWLRDWWLSDAR